MRAARYATTLTLVLMIGVAAASAQQISPVSATLTLPDTKLLPGVPFDMWIEVANSSDVAVTIGLFPTLVVQADGKKFEIAPPRNEVPALMPPDDYTGTGAEYEYVTLAAHEKRTLTLPVFSEHFFGYSPFFSSDSRLMPPGHYTLAIRLDAHPEVIATHTPTPVTFQGALLTNAVAFERMTPTGPDAKVWQRMKEVSVDGRWMWPRTCETPGVDPRIAFKPERLGIWNEIITKYPDSNYFSYAVLADPRGDSAFREALDRFPDSPVAEYVHLGLWHRDRFNDPKQEEHKRVVEGSKRPTTRVIAFGREDLPKAPCPPGYDCGDKK